MNRKPSVKKFEKHRRSSRHGQSMSDGLFVIDSGSAIKEYIRFRPDCVRELKVQDKVKPYWEKQFAGLLSEGIKFVAASADDPPICATVKLKTLDFDEFLARKKAIRQDVVVALDHISDPRNLGAIVRSAAFFGVDTVIVPQDRQALLSPASVATAMGGFALVDLVVVTNMTRALSLLKEHEYWILGTDMDGESTEHVLPLHEKVILVLGSEEKGLSRLVKEQVDHVISVCGAPRSIDSLNVSVAAALFIEKFTAFQRSKKTSQT